MRYAVSFSGGVGSFAAACISVEEVGHKNVDLIFCDTTIEDLDLYRFIVESAAKLNCNLVRLKDGRDPWRVFKDKKYQGNTRTAHCSTELKQKPFREFISHNYDGDTTIVFGFDWTETHRHDRAVKNWHPYIVDSPLIRKSVPKEDCLEYLKEYDIELPKLYKLGFTHNNCGGFCVKAGQAHYARLLHQLPEVYLYHENKQQELMALVPNVRPFLRITVNKELRYLTLREFREMLTAGYIQVDKYDVGGCGCFSE